MQEGTIASINCQPMIEHLFDAIIVKSSENFKRGLDEAIIFTTKCLKQRNVLPGTLRWLKQFPVLSKT